MANRLANETSPYLRQHAENPVDWYPWGDEAFAAARERDVPILLSIGYSSCHWCHVMAHESFEDPDTAAEMNRSFVNVKVDREERPDVDAVYMEATQAMTGAGGWPMTVFLTPEGEPFYCGTYFPAEPRGGQPTFRQLLGAIELAWRDQRDAVREQAGRLVDAIRTTASAPADAGLPDTSTLDEATMSMLSVHDARFGGFGTAPKFPQAMAVDHLLRHHARTGSRAALEAAVTTLDAMASGGIHDHLGGGFSRYSVDERWLVPHFEKMLYDNVLLARAYLHAWQLTDEDRFLQVLEETLGYVLDVLSHPDGGRYSAEDADSLPPGAPEGARPEEGAFYLWTPEQVAEALEAAGLGEVTEQALEWWGIRPGGNFEGRSIPNRLHARGGLARPPAIEAARSALERARRQRPRPGLDDKVLTEWNAPVATRRRRRDGSGGLATRGGRDRGVPLRAPPATVGRRWAAPLAALVAGRRWRAAPGVRVGPRGARRRVPVPVRGDRRAAVAAGGPRRGGVAARAVLGHRGQRVEHRRRCRGAGHPPEGPDRRRDAVREQPRGGRAAAARGAHRRGALRRARPADPAQPRWADHPPPPRLRPPPVGRRAARAGRDRGGGHR